MHQALLGLGPIDDWDNTYVNGVLIGSTHEYTEDRQYKLDPGVLKEGKNLIVVKVTDTGGGGGLDGMKGSTISGGKWQSFSVARGMGLSTFSAHYGL